MTEFPNWFDITARDNFTEFLLPDRGYSCLRYLQIGVFTGDASVWLLENVLTSPLATLDDIDTWTGSPHEAQHDTFDWIAIRHLYHERTKEYISKLGDYQMTSRVFFHTFATPPYDFIYIDGAHDATAVLEDAIDAHRVLAPGGIIAFDDYTWLSGISPLHDPGPAIDVFRHLYQDAYDVLAINAQVWLRKKEG